MTKTYNDAIYDVLKILDRWAYITIVGSAIATIQDQVRKLLITPEDLEKQMIDNIINNSRELLRRLDD